MKKLKEGDELEDNYGNKVIFLEVYGMNRDHDFVGRDKDGNVRNYMWEYIKDGKEYERHNPGSTF